VATDRAGEPVALSLVETPDWREVLARVSHLRSDFEARNRTAWVGFLVTEFTNEELAEVCDFLTIEDTYTLRKLGVIGEDQGFDGTPESRARCRAKQEQPREALS
jgi:hypothetical protein